MALRSHLLAAAAFGPYAVDERTYAASLWDTVPDQSLVLIDRNYLQANVLVPLTSRGTERHWITRAKSNTKFWLIRRLGNGDELVEFQVSSEARRKDPSLPTHFDARAIRYQRKGFQPQLLLTSLVDDSRFPADEIRALYHERWELEISHSCCSPCDRPIYVSEDAKTIAPSDVMTCFSVDPLARALRCSEATARRGRVDLRSRC